MPIVEPPSITALGLVPFQINPHFTDAQVPNHGGETRTERLLEYASANPDVPVVGLREGTALLIENAQTTLVGGLPAMLFHGAAKPRELPPGALTI
jgi:dipeptidase E